MLCKVKLSLQYALIHPIYSGDYPRCGFINIYLIIKQLTRFFNISLLLMTMFLQCHINCHSHSISHILNLHPRTPLRHCLLLYPDRYSARLMTTEGHLQETPCRSGFGSTVNLSTQGSRWLTSTEINRDIKMMLMPTHEMLALDREAVKPELTLAARYCEIQSYIDFQK